MNKTVKLSSAAFNNTTTTMSVPAAKLEDGRPCTTNDECKTPASQCLANAAGAKVCTSVANGAANRTTTSACSSCVAPMKCNATATACEFDCATCASTQQVCNATGTQCAPKTSSTGINAGIVVLCVFVLIAFGLFFGSMMKKSDPQLEKKSV